MVADPTGAGDEGRAVRIVDLGPRCNNACRFCPRGAERAQGERVTFRQERPEEHAPGAVVALVGGEPTLHADLLTRVEEAARRGAEVWVQTNARRLAYLPYARELVSAGVRGVDVSLHGSTPQMHDYHTCAAGSFAQTVRGLVHAKQAGMRVVVTCVTTRANYRHLTEIAQLAMATGAGAIRVRGLQVMASTPEGAVALLPAPQLVRVRARALARWAQGVGWKVCFERPTGEGFVDFPASDLRTERELRGEPLRFEGKARPATGERRGVERRTGQDLAEILPALFDQGLRER